MTKTSKKLRANKAKAIAKLWARGNLRYKLRPEQRKLHDLISAAPTDMAVFNISRRFGKSTTCVLYCVEQAIKKKQRIRYATAFLTDLEEFIAPIFEWLLSDCPPELQPKWKASKKEYRFKNGSVIKLIGLDRKPNGLRGNNLDLVVIDECAFVSNLARIYKSTIVPATMKRKFKLLFPSTPPESPEHFWASELIPKAKEKGTYVELTIEAISDLPEEEKLRLINEVGGIESAEAQREFYCKIIVDASRAVAPSFKPHHVQTIEPTHIHWQIFGDTGGVRDLTVFLQVGWSHELQKTIFRDELWFPAGTPTTTIIKAIKSKWPDFQVIMDAPGQLRIDYSSLGLTTMAVQKDDFAAGLLLLNTSLLNQNVLIHPDCKLFIRTLEGGMLNGQRTDHLRTDSLGHNDAAAAGIYGLRGVDKVTDLRPKPNPQDTITIETHTELETTFLHAFKRKA